MVAAGEAAPEVRTRVVFDAVLYAPRMKMFASECRAFAERPYEAKRITRAAYENSPGHVRSGMLYLSRR